MSRNSKMVRQAMRIDAMFNFACLFWVKVHSEDSVVGSPLRLTSAIPPRMNISYPMKGKRKCTTFKKDSAWIQPESTRDSTS
jgi:hypothetical protein